MLCASCQTRLSDDNGWTIHRVDCPYRYENEVERGRWETDVLLRDKYHCTEEVRHRISGEMGRCPMVGSEMVVLDGRAMCPRHAREFLTVDLPFSVARAMTEGEAAG